MAGDVRVQKASKVLNEEIAALREQAAIAKRRPRQPGANDAGAPVDEASSTEQGDLEQTNADKLLASRVERLQLIQNWITTDGDLLPLIAKVAGDVEGRLLRRSRVVNIVLSTIFLIAGWLLSTVATPIDLGHIFSH